MKQVISLAMFVSFLLGVMGTSPVWGKNHVRIDRIQVCTSNGKVKEFKVGKLQKQLDDKGSCLLPACDFNNIFQKGDACLNEDTNDDGFCDLEFVRDGAATPACFSGNY